MFWVYFVLLKDDDDDKLSFSENWFGKMTVWAHTYFPLLVFPDSIYLAYLPTYS